MPKAQTTRPEQATPRYQILSVVGPSGGIDLRTSPTLLAPERARMLVNFALTEPGALVVAPGWTAFSSVSLGSSRSQGAHRVYLNTAVPSVTSTAVTILGWAGGIYTLSDSGGFSTAAVVSGLSTNELSFPSDRDLVAVLDGASTRSWKSTNGSSWTRFGIAPSATAPTLSTLSTGGLSSGEYEVSFTYKDRDLAYESNGSSAYSTITLSASSGAISAVCLNSTDAQVDAIIMYARKVSAGETVLRKISSAAQSSGTNSTFVVTSTAWTSNSEIPTDHNVPPTLSFGVVWKNRWWARSATVTNRLHFTQLFLPQAWPALFYIDIPFDRGDEIRALVPLGDTLIVFGTTRNYVILGQTSLDFEVRPAISSQEGAFGFRAVAVLENGVVHAGASGVYIFDGVDDRLLSHDLEPGWRDLVGNASASDLNKIPMVYHAKRKELRVSVPRRYPTGTWGEWILDLNRTRASEQPAWTASDRTIGGYLHWDGPETQAGNRGRLFSWHSSMARVFEEAVGTSANSSNLTAEYEGPGLTLGPHRGNWPDVRGEYEPHGGTFSIEPLVDGVSQGTQSVAIGSGLALFGTAVFGTAVFAGSGRRHFYKTLPLSANGRTFQLKATYTGQEAFKLYTYHCGVVPEPKPRNFGE